jgi:hypothetical protein
MNLLKAMIPVFVATLGAHAAVKPDVPPSTVREKALELGERLVKPGLEAGQVVFQDLKNPFSPEGFDGLPVGPGAPEKPGQVKEISPRERLEAIAASLAPSGIVNMGGRMVLLLGGKRYSVGDRIPVTHDGGTVEIELVTLDRTTFSVRLNAEQITRALRPPTKP